MTQKPGVPEYWAKDRMDEQVRKIAQVVNQQQKGQGNNSFKQELEVSPAITTEIFVAFAKSNQIAVISPQNTAAALDFALGTTYAVVEEGKITIHHAADSTSRVYGVVING